MIEITPLVVVQIVQTITLLYLLQVTKTKEGR